MDGLISFFLKHHKITQLFIIVFVLGGILAMFKINRQGAPITDFDVFKVITFSPGSSPEDVEINITSPIEDKILEVDDIEKVKSISMENLSLIFVYRNLRARDPKKVDNDVQTALDNLTGLPESVTEKPSIVELTSVNIPVMEIALFGDIEETILRKYAKDFEKSIKTVAGVGRIDKFGYRKKEIHVEADQDKLKEYYVSLGDIMSAIKSRNVRTTGGTLDSYVSEKKIVTLSEFENLEEVKDVVVRANFGSKLVRISDLAEVKEDFEDHKFLSRSNGNRSISLIIYQQRNADVISMVNEIYEHLEILKNRLPDNVKVKVIKDGAVVAQNRLDVLFSNGIMGFILVLLIMTLFMDLKTAFWTSFGIPLSILGSLVLFIYFDVTLNRVSLAGMLLVLGMLVDDAIVVAENVYQKKESGLNNFKATVEGVKEVFWPVISAVSTTIFAFFPILLMSGSTGKVMWSLPVAVILMLLCSLFEGLFILPSHLISINPPKSLGWRHEAIKRIVTFYEKFIYRCLKIKWVIIIGFILFAAATFYLAKLYLGFTLFANKNPDTLWVIAESKNGDSLERTENKIVLVEKIIEQTVHESDLMSYSSQIGHHNTNVYGLNYGNYSHWALITIYLNPADQRTNTAEYYMDHLKKKFKQLDGFDRLDVLPYWDGPPVGKPFSLEFYSDDEEIRMSLEKKTIAYLSEIDGVYGIESSNVVGKDELQLVLNYDKMASFKITAQDVANTVRVAFNGKVVTSLRQDGEEVDYRIKLKGSKKFDKKMILELDVLNLMGKLVPLSHFAKFEEKTGQAVINHYNGSRSVTITAEVDTSKITSKELNELIIDKMTPIINQYPATGMVAGGEGKKTKESFRDFFIAFILAQFAIYLLLVVLFNSYFKPFIVMTVIPFGFVGVILTFLMHQIPFGFVAIIGILGLNGVVVNDSIVLIDNLNQVIITGGRTIQSIAKGAADRFRPIMLTTLSTVFGLMPMAYGIGGNDPFLRPMILGMAWGLIFTTLITLVLLPCIYAVFVGAINKIT